MSSRKRAGFTLVELLVVMAIIAMLVALLVAAASGVWSQSNITVSQNNQKELWTAMQIYENRKQRYPGYAFNPAPNREASWVVALMPYIGMNDVYETWVTTAATPNVPGIPLMMCPGDDQESPGGAWSSYVVNNGIADVTTETRAHGIFFDHRAGVTNKVYVNSSDIQSKDGLATTIGMAENRRAYSWTGTDPGGSVVREYLTGFVWNPNVNSGSANWLRFPINQASSNVNTGTVLTATAADHDAARINGPHLGVAVVMFADGHSAVLSNMIDYTVYNKLCTPDGVSLGQAALDMAEYYQK